MFTGTPTATSRMNRIAVAAPSKAVAMTAVGSKQGIFKGDSAGRLIMTAYAMSLEVATAFSRKTGQPNTTRQYSAITVTKPVGPASPQFLEAGVNNELLTSVEIEFLRQKTYYLAVLAEATVVSCIQYVSDTEATHEGVLGGLNLLEDISFAFTELEIVDLDGETVFSDSWAVPK